MHIETTLHDAAQDMPPANTDGLWERGRRLRRHRRFRTVAIVMFLLASVALVPRFGGETRLPVGRGSDKPGSLGQQFPWHMRVNDSPNGPVVAVFNHPDTIAFEGTGVTVGQDGSYRLIYLPIGLEIGIISPDGRLLAQQELLDLTTGATTSIVAMPPLAWSVDSSKLLLAVDGVAVYDLATGQYTKMHVGSGFEDFHGAFSPDGRLVAVAKSRGDQRELAIVDVATGVVRKSIQLAPTQKLAGTAAWTPDGRSVTLTASESCAWAECSDFPDQLPRWHLQYLDPATGKITDEAASGRSGSTHDLAGWRYGEPVLIEAGGVSLQPRVVLAKVDGSSQVLLTSPPNTYDLMVPRNVLEQADLSAINTSPWAPSAWSVWEFTCLLSTLLMAGAPIAWIVRRNRRPSRSGS